MSRHPDAVGIQQSAQVSSKFCSFIHANLQLVAWGMTACLDRASSFSLKDVYLSADYEQFEFQ